MEYAVIAYYHFFEIENPEQEAKIHKEFLETINGRGRIYFASEGVNAQLALHRDSLDAYKEFLSRDPRFSGADIKVQYFDEPPFAKLTVKSREQLVALDKKVDLSKRAEYISPEDWAKVIEEQDENTIIIDVRNNYESEIGHFEGAIKPDLENFREFVELAENLKKSYDAKKTRILTYCTGGIRCELFTPLLKEQGFEEVYQLHGGVIKYGEKLGDKHWHGKLFVFDDRLAVPLDQAHEENRISHCCFCHQEADQYFNCANMDCNALFIACSDCIKEHQGCCGSECIEHGRVRTFDPDQRSRPFRKLSFEEKQAISQRQS